MISNREIFLQDVNEFISSSKNTSDEKSEKSKFLKLVKKYHPDINHEIDKGILNEYMTILNSLYEKLQKGKIFKNGDKDLDPKLYQFNFDIFYQLFVKFMELGISIDTLESKLFSEYVNLFALKTIIEWLKGNIHKK